ncbi:ScbA/BarX family gamma-butyrolactone biosynthesis protein [Streptomyces sp. AC512_CC834]|uniref:ScbA/BarX family gamma-butyrolactone biosynthesis protein n=1 Tax=Streptomyces sp. AC512_CC834 TaxID=2823691 RepID=UPI001C26D5A6|nr:ScbA/BarX family gamma-butyrolactone biosynthesis protein [Streptomyces sp. AC512_CC834]
MHDTTMPATGHGQGADSLRPAPETRLSFTGPMPRSAVHKEADSEVLLTDAKCIGKDRFTIAALWPRDHFLRHRGADAPSDPFLLVESVRQTSIFLSHRFYGVPQEHPFVLCDLGFDLEYPLPPRRDSPLPVVLDAVCVPTTNNPRRFGMRLETTAYIDGRRIGRASLHWLAMAPKTYQLVRFRGAPAESEGARGEQSHAAPVPPQAVGHCHDRDVLLGWEPDGVHETDQSTWRLRINRDHPVLFDHHSDHIPGMLLLEACRQAALVGIPQTSDPLRKVSATFTSFGELSRPVTLHARQANQAAADEHPGISVTALQEGKILASAVVRGNFATQMCGAAW